MQLLPELNEPSIRLHDLDPAVAAAAIASGLIRRSNRTITPIRNDQTPVRRLRDGMHEPEGARSATFHAGRGPGSTDRVDEFALLVEADDAGVPVAVGNEHIAVGK